MTSSASAAKDTGIGVLGAAAIGIGAMVGGGIFAVLGVAALEAGGATPLSFVVAGVIAALTAGSYARLSVRFVSGGGTVAFVDRAFGVGVLTGTLNIVLWAGYIGTTALYAAAFGNYAGTFLPGGSADGAVLRVLIVVGIAVPWLINLLKASLVAGTETIVVTLKLAILVLVVVAGAFSVSGDRLAASDWPSALSIVSAGMLIFVAYEGFELIANSADEVREPERTLPRAYALCLGVVIVLYVAIATVTVGSLSPDRIAASADFALAEASSSSLGRAGFDLVGVSAVLATLSAINATLYGTARLSLAIAAEGELPPEFERRPWNQPIGLHLTAAGAALIACVLPLASISSLSSAIFLAVFAAVNAAAWRVFDTTVARVVAGVGCVGCVASLMVLSISSFDDDPQSMLALALLVAAVLAAERAVLHRMPAGAG